MSRLIDEFGRDLGEIVEVSSKDSTDPAYRAYDVYVQESTEAIGTIAGNSVACATGDCDKCVVGCGHSCHAT